MLDSHVASYHILDRKGGGVRMKTVKEVSELSGISVRTLHYYDEIGLLVPTEVSEAGYRFYDDKTIERLQRILYFREFDLPLKEIGRILDDPDLDMQKMLASQRELLNAKRERLERLVSSMDEILRGENRMDFTVFDKTEIEEMYEDVVSFYSPKQIELLEDTFGSMEEYRQQYVENASRPQTQEHFAKMVEWYGDKDIVREFLVRPGESQIGKAYGNRIEEIYRRLAGKMREGVPVTDFQVKSLIGELGFVMREFVQMEDDVPLLKNLIHVYRTYPALAERKYSDFGEGITEYLADAIEAYCGEDA